MTSVEEYRGSPLLRAARAREAQRWAHLPERSFSPTGPHLPTPDGEPDSIVAIRSPYDPDDSGRRMYRWYRHGNLHRAEGPAAIEPDVHRWSLDGIAPLYDLVYSLDQGWANDDLTEADAEELLARDHMQPLAMLWLPRVIAANPSPHLSENFRVFISMQA